MIEIEHVAPGSNDALSGDTHTPAGSAEVSHKNTVGKRPVFFSGITCIGH